MGHEKPWALLLLQAKKGGVVDLGLPYESGGIVGAQYFVDIHQYYMVVKYDLKGYSGQAALPDEHQTLMYAFLRLYLVTLNSSSITS